MKKLKTGILFTAITTMLAFMSVLYISSCNNKAPGLSPFSCENVNCQNGGTCNQGQCTCPVGYQDSRCSTPSKAKFVGIWNIIETVTASDTYDSVGNQRNYQVIIDSAQKVPNDIHIGGLHGNGTYTDIEGVIDSTNIGLSIQPYTPISNGNFNIKGGYAYLAIIKNSHDTAFGTYYTDYINGQFVREHDTISFFMTK